jgi:hypothetical protein
MNTGLQHSSLKSIFSEASLLFMSRWRRTLLMRMDWYPAVGAAWQLEPNSPKRTELYLVMSV